MENYNHELVLKFLEEYDWVYNFQLTKFFLDRVWENIPREWCEVLLSLSIEDLNRLPYGNTRDEWPDSLKEFIRTALTLSLPRSPRKCTIPLSIDPEMRRGMTPKKQHEVSLMSSVVHDIAQRADCEVILDIGSGLGYLGQLLQKQFGYHIIGLESKQSHTSGAERRVRHTTDHKNGIQNVTFELEKGQENMDKFSELVNSACQSQNQSNTTETEMNFRHLQQKRGESNHTGNSKTAGQSDSDHDDLVLRQPLSETDDRHRCDEEHTCSVSGNRKACQECKSVDQQENKETVTKTVYCDKCKACDLELDNLTLKQPQQFLGVCNSCEKGRDVEGQTKVLRHPPDFNSECLCSDVMVQDSQLTLTHFERPMTLTLPHALMIGLHCCGDLTPTMMEYFQSLDFVRGLCCVSCCYHRMKVKAGNGTPHNFPMSATTSKIYNGLRTDNPMWHIGTFALRLAAQETRARWGKQTAEDHDYHTKNVGYRGILELYKHTKYKKCEKSARRIAKKSDFPSFTAYIDAASCRLEAEEETGLNRTELLRLYEENKDKMKFIEPLTALQYLLQPVLEGLITADRAQYLKECGITTEILPIFDEAISPRNLALISVK